MVVFQVEIFHRHAVLMSQHRKEALQVLTKCYSVLMDDLTAIFELHSAEKTSQLDLAGSMYMRECICVLVCPMDFWLCMRTCMTF